MPARHELIWLCARGWERARAERPEHSAVLARWQSENWPAVVRRADPAQPGSQISLGLPLPPEPGQSNKGRLAFHADTADIAAVMQPLALASAAEFAPQDWRAPLAALAEQAQNLGLSLRVFGSLAMQALTGMEYLRSGSDIDLLFYPETLPQLQTGMRLLAMHACILPLDGEIVFPTGQAVAWKEWRMACSSMSASVPRVLVKQESSVRLATLSSLVACLEGPPCWK